MHSLRTGLFKFKKKRTRSGCSIVAVCLRFRRLLFACAVAIVLLKAFTATSVAGSDVNIIFFIIVVYLFFGFCFYRFISFDFKEYMGVQFCFFFTLSISVNCDSFLFCFVLSSID
jgi:hypothetical protein